MPHESRCPPCTGHSAADPWGVTPGTESPTAATPGPRPHGGAQLTGLQGTALATLALVSHWPRWDCSSSEPSSAPHLTRHLQRPIGQGRSGQQAPLPDTDACRDRLSGQGWPAEPRAGCQPRPCLHSPVTQSPTALALQTGMWSTRL